MDIPMKLSQLNKVFHLNSNHKHLMGLPMDFPEHRVVTVHKNRLKGDPISDISVLESAILNGDKIEQ